MYVHDKEVMKLIHMDVDCLHPYRMDLLLTVNRVLNMATDSIVHRDRQPSDEYLFIQRTLVAVNVEAYLVVPRVVAVLTVVPDDRLPFDFPCLFVFFYIRCLFVQRFCFLIINKKQPRIITRSLSRFNIMLLFFSTREVICVFIEAKINLNEN